MHGARRLPLWVALVLLGVPLFTARAERVTEAEALTAAENYVQLILAKDGAWGDAETARVQTILPLNRGDRQLGYYCPVEPAGFIVLPLYKELAPIRAFSVHGRLDPESDEGLANLLKNQLEQLYAAVDRILGRAADPGEDLAAALPSNFRAAWETLTDGAFDPSAYHRDRGTRGAGMDYQEGETLLTSHWHQEPPYNDDCPDMGCQWPQYGSQGNHNAYVGCVATAGAQILRYWGWPPAGVGTPYDDPYDYANMCGVYSYDDTTDVFYNEHGLMVTQAQIDAVAEICREVGIADLMDYSCGGSDSNLLKQGRGFEAHFRYHDGWESIPGSEYTYEEWFQELKDQLNQNRPVEYSGGSPSEHDIVCDGWRVDGVPPNTLLMVHTIFGHYHVRPDWDAWWTLEEMMQSPQESDGMLIRCYPDCAMGTTIDGTWNLPGYPYRYFDRDAQAQVATFAAGHTLPIARSGFLLSNTGTTPTSWITFYGAPANTTQFYLYGDPIAESRIHVLDGALRICAGGQMAIY
jgi:hypothetical protein